MDMTTILSITSVLFIIISLIQFQRIRRNQLMIARLQHYLNEARRDNLWKGDQAIHSMDMAIHSEKKAQEIIRKYRASLTAKK
jgi:hypothetical protein